MLLLDANVLIRAFRVDIEEQPELSAWLQGLIDEETPFGFPDGILMGFVRMVTQRPFQPITKIETALAFANQLRSAPSCRVIAADADQWRVFTAVCTRLRAHGGKAQDVYWASFALAHNATWITFDEGFVSVPGLRWRAPLDVQATTNPR